MMAKCIVIERPNGTVTIVRSEIETPSETPLTEHEEIINELYNKAKKLSLFDVNGSLPSERDVLQKAIDTCPKYERYQKEAQCDGAYITGFGLGVEWFREFLKNND